MPKNQYVSLSVIKRLPRYYRFLGELLKSGVSRISSRELADMMHLTASQIRQDLNCFGGFGQQGYGYNVQALHGEIGNILGIDRAFKTIQIGAGNLGKALAAHMEFTNQGFSLEAIFDSGEQMVGTTIRGMKVRHTDELQSFCAAEQPVVAVLCIPREAAEEMVPQLIAMGIKAFWNFSQFDIELHDKTVAVENVHLGDSLMTLCYQVKDLLSDNPRGEEEDEEPLE